MLLPLSIGRPLQSAIGVNPTSAAATIDAYACDGLIDTGATGTVISRTLAFSLNITTRSASEVVVAGRSEFLPSINVAIWLHLFDGEGHKSPVVMLERTPVVIGLEEPKFDRVIGQLAKAKFEVLIGMDVLERCDLLVERGGEFRLSL